MRVAQVAVGGRRTPQKVPSCLTIDAVTGLPRALTPARSTRAFLGGLAAVLVLALLAPPPAVAARPTGDTPTVSQPSSVGPLASTSSVDARMRTLLAQRMKATALGKDVAITVTDPQTRRWVFASSPAEGQIPASNAKVVTAYTALTVIGPGQRTTTRVASDASSRRLTLVGAGDPMLTNTKIDELAANVIRGIKAKSPNGVLPSSARVLADESLFAPHVDSSGWRSTYVPSEVNPVSALQRFGVRTTNPAGDAAAYFAARLTARGLKAAYVGRAGAGSSPTIATVQGFAMDSIVDRMLLDSDNNIAEVLARRAALAYGRSATWGGWRTTARDALAAAGLSLTGVVIIDGSGLSRTTRIPTLTLAGLLSRASTSQRPELAGFMNRFPLAGVSGTLSASYGRFASPPASCAARKVRAKTGTLSGVYALSGVATARDGRPRAFSFIANAVPSSVPARDVRQALDRLAATVVGCY